MHPKRCWISLLGSTMCCVVMLAVINITLCYYCTYLILLSFISHLFELRLLHTIWFGRAAKCRTKSGFANNLCPLLFALRISCQADKQNPPDSALHYIICSGRRADRSAISLVHRVLTRFYQMTYLYTIWHYISPNQIIQSAWLSHLLCRGL